MASSSPEHINTVAQAATIDPAVIEKWWSGFSWSLLTFGIVTLIFIGITFLIFSLGNLNEISKNFAKYRCNPLMMPFAGQFGYDAKENFEFCISNILNEKASAIFAPLYGILSQFTSVLTVMMNATLGIRKLFSNFFLSINNFIGNVRNRIQNLLFQIRISFLKMNNLMGRVFGTMYAVIYMGTSALTAGNNLGDSDLVKFLSEFCFHPETPVLMNDGIYKTIKTITIGDKLARLPSGIVPRVTSTFVFDGTRTPMVAIEDVIVSAQHYVEYKGKWIAACDHPSAVQTPSIERLICLNVSGNAFYVGNHGLIARDYDESNDPGISKATMNISQTALNGKHYEKSKAEDYLLGFDPRLEISLADGTWAQAHTLKLGTCLEGGNKIVGIVKELCTHTVYWNNMYLSSAQLVQVNNVWKRACDVYPTTNNRKILMHFITDRCGPIISRAGGVELCMRDYREVALPEMEVPYATYLVGVGIRPPLKPH